MCVQFILGMSQLQEANSEMVWGIRVSLPLYICWRWRGACKTQPTLSWLRYQWSQLSGMPISRRGKKHLWRPTKSSGRGVREVCLKTDRINLCTVPHTVQTTCYNRQAIPHPMHTSSVKLQLWCYTLNNAHTTKHCTVTMDTMLYYFGMYNYY